MAGNFLITTGDDGNLAIVSSITHTGGGEIVLEAGENISFESVTGLFTSTGSATSIGGSIIVDADIDVDSDGAIINSTPGGNDITTTNLTAFAAIGIDLDTTISSFVATNTDAGNIAIQNTGLITLGDGVDGVITDNGNIDITSSTGIAVATGSGGTAIEAGGSGDVTLTATTGNVTIGLDDILSSATGGSNLGDGTGTITISANAGTISQAGGGVIRANGLAGSAALSSQGNMSSILTDVRRLAADASAGAIDITNTSTANAALDIAVISGLVGIDSGSGLTNISTSHALNITTLLRGTGDINVTAGTANDAVNGDDLNVNSTVLSSGAGTITLTSNDNVVFNTGGVVQSLSGAINIFADNGPGNTGAIINNTAGVQDINTGIGGLTVSAATGISLDTSVFNLLGATNTTSGLINIANNGSLTIASAVLNSGGGGSITSVNDIDVSATVTMAGNFSIDAGNTGFTGNLFLNDSVTHSAGGQVTLTADDNVRFFTGGNVTSAGGSVIIIADSDVDLGTGLISNSTVGVVDVTSTNLTLQASDGIDLDTAVTNLLGATNTNDAITIDNTGALTITGTVTNTNGGGTITAASPLTVNAAVTMGADFSLIAGNSVAAGDDLVVNANVIHSGGGIINLTAGDEISFTGINGFARSVGGTINVTADNEGDQTNGITNDGSPINHLEATNLVISSGTGIDLDVSVEALSADNTGTGNVNIDAVCAICTNIDVNSLTTASGTITYNQTGGPALTLVNANTGTGGDVTITNTSDVALGSVTAGNLNTIVVTSSTGQITDNNGATTNVNSGTLNATAATGIILDGVFNAVASVTGIGDITLSGQGIFVPNLANGLSTNNGNINLTTDQVFGITLLGSVSAGTNGNIDFVASGGGGIDIRNSVSSDNGATGDGIGNIDLTSDLNIVRSGAGAVVQTEGTITLSAVGNIGTSGNSLLTDTNQLNVTDGGDVFLQDADSLILIGSGSTSLNRFEVTAANQITSLASADYAVTNNAFFDSTNDDDITLTAGTFQFGTLTFDGGNVAITETGATVISGTSNATSLDLTADDSITLSGFPTINVTGNASFTSVNDAAITVDSGNLDFGSLTFNGGIVTIANGIATAIEGSNSGTTVSLSSGGGFTDNAGASITATNLALVALNNSINLDNAASHDVDIFAAAGSFNPTVIVFEDVDDLTVGTVAGTVGVQNRSGNVTLRSGGTLSVNSVINAGLNGNVSLTTTAGDVALNTNVSSSLTTAAAPAGNGNGTITINAANDITRSAGALQASGAAGGVSLTATANIGTLANNINTDVNRISANSTATGDVFILENDNVILVDLDANDGNITVANGAGGNITTQDVFASGTVTLTADGSILDDNDDGTTSIEGQDVVLNANVSIGANGAGPGTPDEFLDVSFANISTLVVNAASAFLNFIGADEAVDTSQITTTVSSDLVLAVDEDLDINDGAFKNPANTFNLSLIANNIIFSDDGGSATQGIETTGSVTLSTPGSISGGDVAAPSIIASSIDLDAVSGIGLVQSLQTQTASLSADTTNGNVDIENTFSTAVVASSLTTGIGNIDFVQNGAGPVTVTSATTVDGTVSLDSDSSDLTTGTYCCWRRQCNISLTADNGGGLVIGSLDANGNDIFLVSDSTIIDNNAGATIILHPTNLDIGANGNVELDTVDYLAEDEQ